MYQQQSWASYAQQPSTGGNQAGGSRSSYQGSAGMDSQYSQASYGDDSYSQLEPGSGSATGYGSYSAAEYSGTDGSDAYSAYYDTRSASQYSLAGNSSLYVGGGSDSVYNTGGNRDTAGYSGDYPPGSSWHQAMTRSPQYSRGQQRKRKNKPGGGPTSDPSPVSATKSTSRSRYEPPSKRERDGGTSSDLTLSKMEEYLRSAGIQDEKGLRKLIEDAQRNQQVGSRSALRKEEVDFYQRGFSDLDEGSQRKQRRTDGQGGRNSVESRSRTATSTKRQGDDWAISMVKHSSELLEKQMDAERRRTRSLSESLPDNFPQLQAQSKPQQQPLKKRRNKKKKGADMSSFVRTPQATAASSVGIRANQNKWPLGQTSASFGSAVQQQGSLLSTRGDPLSPKPLLHSGNAQASTQSVVGTGSTSSLMQQQSNTFMELHQAQVQQAQVLQQQRIIMQEQAKKILEQQARNLVEQQAKQLVQEETKRMLESQAQQRSLMQQQFQSFAQFLGSVSSAQTQQQQNMQFQPQLSMQSTSQEESSAVTLEELETAKNMAANFGITDVSMILEGIKLVKELGPSGFEDLYKFGNLLSRVGSGDMGMEQMASQLPPKLVDMIMNGRLKPDFIDALMHSTAQAAVQERPLQTKWRPDVQYRPVLDYCKLHISGIPPDLTKQSLKEHFPKARRIDLPKKKAMQIRGLAWVIFHNAVDAREALEKMNGAEVNGRILSIKYAKAVKENIGLPGAPILDFCKLYVRGIAEHANRQDIAERFTRATKIDMPKKKGKGQNRFCYVMFSNARDAEEALNKLNGTALKEKRLIISYFRENPNVPSLLQLGQNWLQQHENPVDPLRLLVSAVPHDLTEDDIKKALPEAVAIKAQGKKTGRKRGRGSWYAFVIFKNKAATRKAYEKGLTLKGNRLTLSHVTKGAGTSQVPSLLGDSDSKGSQVQQKEKEKEKAEYVVDPCKLCMTHITKDISDDDVRNAFPTATSVERRKWIAFITFEDEVAAKKVLEEGVTVKEKKLPIKQARIRVDKDEKKPEANKEGEAKKHEEKEPPVGEVDPFRVYVQRVPKDVETDELLKAFPGSTGATRRKWMAFIKFDDEAAVKKVLEEGVTLREQKLVVKPAISREGTGKDGKQQERKEENQGKLAFEYEPCKLYISHLSLEATNEDLLALPGAKSTYIPKQQYDKWWHAFVEFENEASAKLVQEEGTTLLGPQLVVKQAVKRASLDTQDEQTETSAADSEKPSQENQEEQEEKKEPGKTEKEFELKDIDDPYMLKVTEMESDKVFYWDIKQLFPGANLLRLNKVKNTNQKIALVGFYEADDARDALEQMEGVLLHGKPITIKYAKLTPHSLEKYRKEGRPIWTLGEDQRDAYDYEEYVPSDDENEDVPQVVQPDFKKDETLSQSVVPFCLRVTISGENAYKTTKDDLEMLFPATTGVEILSNKKELDGQCIALVKFADADRAKEAHDKMQGRTLLGVPLLVQYNPRPSEDGSKAGTDIEIEAEPNVTDKPRDKSNAQP